MDRAAAWDLLCEYTESDSLRKHALAVEASMRHYASLGGHDAETWGLAGLLHDFDYERFPNPNLDESGHPWTGVAILRERGYPEELCDAIMGHAPFTHHPRATALAKTLFAVDELCGLIVAMAYVRPTASAVGTRLAVDIRGTQHAAVVVPLPFYDRGKKV